MATVVLKCLVVVWNRWYTGLAGLKTVTGEFLWVFGFVLLTGVIVEAMIVAEFVDTGWVSTIAGTTSVTVDDNLR